MDTDTDMVMVMDTIVVMGTVVAMETTMFTMADMDTTKVTKATTIKRSLYVTTIDTLQVYEDCSMSNGCVSCIF